MVSQVDNHYNAAQFPNQGGSRTDANLLQFHSGADFAPKLAESFRLQRLRNF